MCLLYSCIATNIKISRLLTVSNLLYGEPPCGLSHAKRWPSFFYFSLCDVSLILTKKTPHLLPASCSIGMRKVYQYPSIRNYNFSLQFLPLSHGPIVLPSKSTNVILRDTSAVKFYCTILLWTNHTLSRSNL
jgi:hypothetical protein